MKDLAELRDAIKAMPKYQQLVAKYSLHIALTELVCKVPPFLSSPAPFFFLRLVAVLLPGAWPHLVGVESLRVVVPDPLLSAATPIV